MISILCYNEGATHLVENPDEISELVGRNGRLLWVDLVDPTEADFEVIQREFELHPLAIEDARQHGQRAKLEQYPSHAFVVAYSKELAEVDLFIGREWLISVRERSKDGKVWAPDGARARFERTKPEHASVGLLLYTILDEIVDGYFDATDEAEDGLEVLEDRIFTEELHDEREMQQGLFDIRRQLLVFRRAVVPLREVVGALLRREVMWIDEETLVHLQDVYDHVLRAIDLLDGQRELMGNAVDAHLAIISNRMNQVMKRMTSWGAILLVSSLVAGIYGMNFKNMPELNATFGYVWALGLMAGLTITGYLWFKKRDWL